ncbi:hypothetical protein DL95DRAFT_392222 [Leptodontidium sp. 2 PMI_412]|nr:hypothetical protein DL95DRAFT_392222 [Leptodontidium sp. 2 PMI_412]
MTGFSSSYCGSSKLWDPVETLEIINPDPGYQRITCVGYAPSQGRRCRIAINQYNRQTITNTLNEISYLHPSDPNVVSRLRGVAGAALCVRFHQGQASDILSQWRSKLPKVQRTDSEQRPRSSRSQARNQTSKDLQERLRKLRELMDQLEENLEAQKSDCCTDEESDEEIIYEDFQRAKAKDRLERDGLEKERRDQKARKRRDAEQAADEEQSNQRAQARATEAKARKEQESTERERINAERIKREAREAEEAAKKERIRRQRAQERAEQEARERELKEEKERIDKERQEQEAKRKRDAANSASNERIRQRARERAEKAAREKREKEEREQAEWKQAWTRYQDQWVLFKTSPSQHGVLRDVIPWPVKTGLFREVNASAVKAFLENALPAGTLRVKLLRKECQKWHPDVICRWPRAGELTDVERLMLDMICRVVTDQLNSSSGRSSEFL